MLDASMNMNSEERSDYVQVPMAKEAIERYAKLRQT